MSAYFRPLGVFIGGCFLLLILWIFLPAIGVAGTQLAADTAAHASTFWGWTWAVSSIKILIVVFGFLLVLLLTFVTFLSTKNK